MKTGGDSGDMRARLSILWIFASLNYIYADVVTLFDKSITTSLSQTSLLAFGALVETAFAMVLLSRLLEYRANRWANILVGVIQTIVVLASLLIAVPAAYYAMFAIIEIATTLVIIWQAWAWKQ
jgi:Family of unknown function (DUF6326)